MTTQRINQRGRGTSYERPAGSGRWELRVIDPKSHKPQRKVITGHPRTRSGAVPRSVEVELAAFNDEVKHRRPVTDAKTRHTVAEMFDAWESQGDIEESSLAHVKWTRKALEGILDWFVEDLSPDDVGHLYDQLRAHGKRCSHSAAERAKPGHRNPVCPKGGPMAPATVVRLHGDFRAALQYVTDEKHWIVFNPAAGKKPKTKGKRNESKKRTAPTDAEVERILVAAEATKWELYVCLRLASVMGTRAGEQVGLRWVAFDLDEGTVRVERVIAVGPHGYVEKPHTKGGRDRVLVLDPDTVAIVRRHRTWCEERAARSGVILGRNAYLFSRDPGCQQAWLPSSLGAMYRRLTASIGLSHVWLHDLRRYVATTLIAEGMPLPDVQRVTGHDDIRVLVEIYNTTATDANRKAAEIMAARRNRKPALTVVEHSGSAGA